MSTKIDDNTLRGLLIVLGWEYRVVIRGMPDRLWYRKATTEELLHVNRLDVSMVHPSCLYASTLQDAARIEAKVSGINLLGGTQDENT